MIFKINKNQNKMTHQPPITSARIRSVRLIPMTDEYISKYGVVKVESTKQFADGVAQPRGTYDGRMGTIFETYACSTCGQNLTKCPGHFGFYPLSFPAQYLVYEKVILKHLRLICIRCYRYIMDPTLHAKKPTSGDVGLTLKFMTDAKLPSNKKYFCDYCNDIRAQMDDGVAKGKYVIRHVHPKYKKSQKGDPTSIGYQVQTKYKDSYVSEDPKNFYANMMYNDEILELFEKLPDSELIKFGIPVESHPRHFLTRYLYILPVNLRFINNNKNQSYNNQITTCYEKIIKENEKIKSRPSKSDMAGFKEYIDICKSMISKITEMIKSSNDKNETVASIATGGKGGVIRKDLLAKQVGGVFRDVIVCNTDIPVDTIYFPLEQAIDLVVEENVTQYNINQLQKLVVNGEKYPGCAMIKCAENGYKKSAKYLGDYRLKPGDIVYRHLVSGDPVPFHRHPTLTPTCITAVKLEINPDIDNKSTGLNPAACAKYNADFDGDMMNGYVVQKENARVETAEIMKTQNMFREARVSAGGNSNILGQIQDAVIGIGLLTLPGVELTRFETIGLFQNIPNQIEFTKTKYTGREIFSFVLPNINYEAKSPIVKNELIAKYLNLSDDDTKVVIKRGKLISGVVCDSILKDGYGSLYHAIFHTFGSKIALEYIHKHQLLVKKFLEIQTYTIGFRDILYGKETEKLINLIQSKIMTKLRELDNMLLHRQLKTPTGVSNRDHYMNEISRIHGASSDAYLGAILQTVSPLENNILKSIILGAKGKLNNLYAIMACVGIIKLDGKFIPQSLDVFRHSIFLRQFSSEPSAFGYVYESYNMGIGHASMYNTASGARQNILTKSMGTGEAGAEGRNLIKTNESINITNNRFSARNNGLSIVEFSCGDDGFESIMCMQNDYSGIQKPDKEIREMMKPTKLGGKLVDAFIDQIIADKYEYLKYVQTREKIGFIYKCNYKLITPADFKAIIWQVLPDEPHKTTDKELNRMIELINDWVDNIHYIPFNPVNKKLKKKMLTSLEVSFRSVRIAARYFLNPRFLETCSPKHLEMILKLVETKILESLYTPGKNIGTVIGQAVTAPFTQYLIDAHHAAATGGTSKEGLKYFKALISLKDISTISQKRMYIYVKEKYEEDKQAVADLAEFITSKPLAIFINKSRVLVEPYGAHLAFPEDKKFHGKPIGNVTLQDIVFRYTLSSSIMDSKNTNISDIAIKIEKHFGTQAYCVYSPTPIDGEYVMCIYFSAGFEFGNKTTNYQNVNDLWAAIDGFRRKFNWSFITNEVPNVKGALVKSKEIVSIGEGGKLTKKNIYYIQTDGIELEHILRINIVDKARTTCSHIRKTYDIFGTITAKEICVNELEQTLASLNLAYNNFTFLANIMFENGYPENLGEVGQKKREGDDIFLLAAHRGPMNNLANGAINASETRIDSPTANLMVGQVPNIGTNYNDICYKELEVIEEEDLI